MVPLHSLPAVKKWYENLPKPIDPTVFGDINTTYITNSLRFSTQELNQSYIDLSRHIRNFTINLQGTYNLRGIWTDGSV